jgi:hypothetical protein
MDDNEQIEREQIEETARRLASAIISMQMGLSLEYYYRTYAKGQEIGTYWIDLAIRVRKERVNPGFSTHAHSLHDN